VFTCFKAAPDVSLVSTGEKTETYKTKEVPSINKIRNFFIVKRTLTSH
jgi:hypothetical protein